MENIGALTEVSLLILLSLYEPRHGYAVMLFIEQKTKGRLRLGAGSLYGALNNLADKGWITPLSEADRRRKEYVISDAGKQIVQGEMERLAELSAIAAEITEGASL
ncbi:MAG: PadR family transcriptional regulator [Trichococcus flocculiformis]|uniref:PadR family transcriptional regulator n=1 Tax=Trichococcus flocculiformis TaxID=82803 RepID=A0A847D2I2_9LACT|nr:helix-turn-helix transcriptional regulator [Trichococcus flocculiformis]NLD31302.1 PadR family transcriptional regulator [Trichococcus flocculiformis]